MIGVRKVRHMELHRVSLCRLTKKQLSDDGAEHMTLMGRPYEVATPDSSLTLTRVATKN